MLFGPERILGNPVSGLEFAGVLNSLQSRVVIGKINSHAFAAYRRNRLIFKINSQKYSVLDYPNFINEQRY